MLGTITRKDVILLTCLGDNDLLDVKEDIYEEIKPGRNILNNIFNYSKALRVIKTKNIENVHVILN